MQNKKAVRTIIVTGRTRRDTCGSMCKALLYKGMVKTGRVKQRQAGVAWARHRVILGQAWVDDRRTISNKARQRDNPGTRAIIQARHKQSPNGETGVNTGNTD